MRPLVAVPVVDPVPPVDYTGTLRAGVVRRAAERVLERVDMLPPLAQLLDGFCRDRRLSPAALGRIAADLLEQHGLSVGDDVPAAATARVLTTAMAARRARLRRES